MEDGIYNDAYSDNGVITLGEVTNGKDCSIHYSIATIPRTEGMIRDYVYGASKTTQQSQLGTCPQ